MELNLFENNSENSLVEIIGNKIVVSSRQVAEHFNKRHDNVLQTIKNNLLNFKEITNWFYETSYTDDKGRVYPEYLMNKDGFSLLVMGFTGKEAMLWKIKYIEAFNAMAEKLKLIEQQEIGRIIERMKGKEIRKTLTDAIKENVPESPHKRFMYKNYTDLAYKKVFGMNAKQIREDRGLEKGDSLRDYLSVLELKKLKGAENAIKGFLDMGYSYDEVKNIMSEKYLA
ncbi:Rha family transcriptional regulator [Megamonas sp.]